MKPPIPEHYHKRKTKQHVMSIHTLDPKLVEYAKTNNYIHHPQYIGKVLYTFIAIPGEDIELVKAEFPRPMGPTY